jgi:hypothetical protein
MRIGWRPVGGPVASHPFGKAGFGKRCSVARWHEPRDGNPLLAETRFLGCDDLDMRTWYPGEGDPARREFMTVTVHGVMVGVGCRVGFVARSVE